MAGRVTYLGEFEQVVLLAVARLGADAYGASIRREIHARSGRDVTIGAVHATLDRLAGKGFLRPRHGTPLPARAGRARKYVDLTVPGVEALEEARRLQAVMWSGVSLRKARRT